MKRLLAGLLILIVLAVPVFSAQASAPQQDPSPTLTPTATVTRQLPTSTITPTLLPPPAGGGRVAVTELVVRGGPSLEWYALGGLRYGEEIYPLRRDPSGVFVSLNYRGNIGWVSWVLVSWDPDLDLTSLPLEENPFALTPVTPGSTLPLPSATLSPVQPTVNPTATPEVQDATPPAESPGLPPTPSPSQTVPTLTPVEAADINGSADTISTNEPAVVSLPDPLTRIIRNFRLPFTARSLGYIGIGAIILGMLAYGWRFIGGEQERERYREGFGLSYCPVCQKGSLLMEENAARSLGMARVGRSVRCNNCRSVLRQVRPGIWRYSIDPLINPELAAAYSGKEFADADLPSFAVDAAAFEPQVVVEVSQEREGPSPEEIIAELEARALAEAEAEERETAEREAEEKAADEADTDESNSESDNEEQ